MALMTLQTFWIIHNTLVSLLLPLAPPFLPVHLACSCPPPPPDLGSPETQRERGYEFDVLYLACLHGSREQAAARAKGAGGRAGPALPWSQRGRR